MATFRENLTEHVGAAVARQLAFAEGLVRFGQDLAFPIQLLGTEAYGDETWLWAWGNTASGLPDKLLVAAGKLRELGIQQGIREFSERSFALEIANGHSLALAASGIIGNCCYYRGPYERGALFFLVCQPPDEVLRPVRSERAVTVVSEVISQFDVDHQKMAVAFLQSQGFNVDRNASQTLAKRGSDTITLGFDSQGRLSQIGGELKPQPPVPVRKWWEFWKA